MMKSTEIRQAFFDYFKRNGHEIVASSPLVPGNDPTLLFTNAGMVQFKDVFTGQDKRPYSRAASSQRCVRAGGKHNDLENVGYTARHHTFFEMLGNFSFGDYFKREAIAFAWEFLTREMNLPADRLWVTVFKDDDEAADIWLKEVGISAERFSRLGEKDNFWSMGDTGPCGPCTEIFYDHGPEVEGGPPGSPEEDGDRYIEIWNLVFMQFNRSADGNMAPLPKPSVDTGMGLERIAAVMQGVHSNYEIDLFRHLLKAAASLAHMDTLEDTSLRVIADHIRSCSFLIVDGVLPSNEGRGYVLRRIIRRAIRHGHKLGITEAFFHKLVAPLAEEMGDAYPELVTNQAQVEQVLLREEEQFEKTLDQGMRILEQDIAALSSKELQGETIFKLYDTYGFPVDLTADIAREQGLTLDMDGFDTAMEQQRTRARAASQFVGEKGMDITLGGKTDFCGYERLYSKATVRLLINEEGQTVSQLSLGDRGFVVLDRTPFYAESGGQVGDIGIFSWEGGSLNVTNTTKQGSLHLHHIEVESGILVQGAEVEALVKTSARRATMLNHSATHLLHAALRKELGKHIQQKGSLVEPGRLRFDFSHHAPVTEAELDRIELLVNEQIQNNTPVQTEIMNLDDAIASGCIALFGEKYGEQVRVLSMGDKFSVELCGGTHVKRTGDIGVFKIISESGIAAGIRRIEAVTGMQALAYQNQTEKTLQEVANIIKCNRELVTDKVQQLNARNRQLEKELARLKVKLASSSGTDLAEQVFQVKGVNVLTHAFKGVDAKSLLTTLDQLKGKLKSAVVVLASTNGDRVSLIAGVTKDLTNRVKAGELVNVVAEQVGGRGGGRPDMAQAGGNKPAALPEALASVKVWLEGKL